MRPDGGQRRLHQRFGLGARDERAGTDLERQPVELAAPEDVRERLVLAAALQQRLERREMLGGGRLARRGDDLHARQPGCLAVQQLGLEARFVEVAGGVGREQLVGRRVQPLAERGDGLATAGHEVEGG